MSDSTPTAPAVEIEKSLKELVAEIKLIRAALVKAPSEPKK